MTLRDYLTSQGFTYIGQTGKGHQKWERGQISIVTSNSPSDHRSLANLRAVIRRKEKESE